MQQSPSETEIPNYWSGWKNGKVASVHLTAIPTGQGDGDRVFVASVIEDALGRMTRAVEVIKDTQISGGERPMS